MNKTQRAAKRKAENQQTIAMVAKMIGDAEIKAYHHEYKHLHGVHKNVMTGKVEHAPQARLNRKSMAKRDLIASLKNRYKCTALEAELAIGR